VQLRDRERERMKRRNLHEDITHVERVKKKEESSM
jgi:hypothetical protein